MKTLYSVAYYLLCFQQYLDGPLNLTIQALQESHLEAMRAQGVDVRRHIIDTGEWETFLSSRLCASNIYFVSKKFGD